MNRHSGRVSEGVSQVARGSRVDEADKAVVTPEAKRAMSVDDIATLAARVANGENVSHPLAYQAMGLACESVRRMIYKMALKYAGTCRTDPDDLVQECMKRIVTRIGDFNLKYGKFTTWSCTVSSSVLNGFYRRQSGWNTHIVTMDANEMRGVAEPKTEPDSSGLLRMDIMETVDELVKKHPSKEKLIMAMFGNPKSKGFNMPTKVMLAEASKETGVCRAKAMEFFRNVVQPYFIRRFSESPNDLTPVVLPAKRTGGLPVVDAAIAVLRSEYRPMGAKELYAMAVNRGLYVSDARNPYISFCSVLGKAVLRGDKRLRRTGSAMWEVAA